MLKRGPSVYLRLGRVSNLPTVWTNVVAGAVLSGAAPRAATLVALAAALSAFYVGGMYLNDGFDRDIETTIYNTLPDNLHTLLARHPLRCPAAFIGGLQSQEIGQVGLAMTRQVTQGRMTMMDGSHLFPMEKPQATAAAIEAALLAIGG